MNLLALLLTSALLLFGSNTFAACAPQQILRDDVLIVVNDNSIASPQIGDYYCEQRGIDPANIAHVRVPATSDVLLDQFIVLRDQLIKFLLENTLPAGMQPANCNQSEGYTPYYCPATVDQIRQHTKIRYLVLTKGIPARFTFTGSTLPGNPEGVVDNYLRFWLTNYFDRDVRFTINQRAIDFADGRGMRTVDPVIDREFIVGRIEGVDVASSMKLVDRAIAAEQDGIFGKLYGSKFGPLAELSTLDGAYLKQWLPNGGTNPIYPSWEYLHGLFGDLQSPDNNAIRHLSNTECITYDVNGKVPQDCVTRLTSGGTDPAIANDQPPGNPYGRITRADNSLIYQGYADGFSSLANFNQLLNWSETDSCTPLCEANDAACLAASTDVYREIDTRCVRVADGFIGYNHQSYPLGIMAAWPTGWFQSSNIQPYTWGLTGSNSYFYWAPEVRNDTGYDDNYSLWYQNTDQTDTAACYLNSDDLENSPADHCLQEKRFYVSQRINLQQPRAIDLASPQQITVRFKYRAIGISKTMHLMVALLVHEEPYQDQSVTILDNNQIYYQHTSAKQLIGPNSPADATSWGDAVATFTLDPALHQHPQKLYDGIKIRIASDRRFEGQLAIDYISVDEDGTDIPLLNASFDAGHQQLSGGDSAVSFLNRLNGVAFWGNISHHESIGHSFGSHPYETLVYFMRGLPLGDAVWFAETHNSGILYGDPLYSPAAVHLHRLPSWHPQAPDDHFLIATPIALHGDTQNGSGTDVSTTYSLDYCSGLDFHSCDLASSWLPINNLQNQPGGTRNMTLGNWDVTQLAAGNYTVRLAVSSTNASKNVSQTFYDYYPISLFDPASDEDGDGLSYAEEISHGTDYQAPDTDDDGINDHDEVYVHGTSPLLSDTDGDSYDDYTEINDNDPQTDPEVFDPTWGDINGDRLVNIADIILGTRASLWLRWPSQGELFRGNVAPLIDGNPSPAPDDYRIDAGDVLLIQRKALNLIDF